MPRERKLDKQVLVLCTEKEREELHERAQKTGKSLSRYLVLAGLNREKNLPTREDIKFFKDAIFQVRRIGTNLNQIAHALHVARRGAGQEPTFEDISTAIKETEDLIKRLKNLL